MEKNKLDIATREPVSFYFGKAEMKIIVDPYISLMNQSIFMRDYIDLLFKEDDFENGYFVAEWSLVMAIIDKMTNVQIMPEENTIDLNIVVNSGLWDEIRERIVNYDDFKNKLLYVVEKTLEQKALEKSIGVTIDKVANQAMIFLEKYSQLDLSEEGVKKLIEALNGLNPIKPLSEVPEKKSRAKRIVG